MTLTEIIIGTLYFSCMAGIASLLVYSMWLNYRNDKN